MSFEIVGLNGRHLRPHNRSALLRLLRSQGPLSRVALATRSGLSATTVTKVVNDLLAEGYVAEASTPASRPARGKLGRPPIDLALVPSARVVCGVQVGVGTVQMAVCDLLANVLEDGAFHFDADTPADDVLEMIAAALPPLVEAAGYPLERVIGVGVGAPGPVDRAQRVNLLSINLGWRNVPFSDRLERTLGVPTVVDHNVRAMALAETRYGQGRGCESLAFVYVRTGVGAGLVMNGQPYRGGTHGATELGHLHVGASDLPCQCGSIGCLETVASESYLLDRTVALAAAQPDGSVARELEHGGQPLAALVAAATAGDEAAAGILDEASGHLATGMANLANLLNPELIVVGGFYSETAPAFLPSLRRQFRVQLFPLLRDAVQIEPTRFGASVGVVGAAAVALERCFYGVDARLEPLATGRRSTPEVASGSR